MSLDQDKNRRYGLRKLNVGLASVLIGISFVSAKGQVVKADSVKDNAKSAINEQAVKPEKQDMQSSILKGTSEPAKQNAKNVDMVGKSVHAPSVQTSINKENRSENSNSSLNSNDISSLNKNMQTVQNDVPRENRTEVPSGQTMQTAITQPQKKQQTSSTQNSAGKPQKNLLDDLGKQKTFTQAGDRVKDISQTQNEQKLDLTKNSKKFAKKVLATNLIETNSLAMTNGGFDSSWGTLDVNDWQGSVQGDYYQLTDYTGDANHVIVPNEADFEKAGISTSGKQVGVTSGLMKRIFTSYETTAHDATVAFSKTDDKQVKAINADWYDTWNSQDNNRGAKLSRFDGTNLDVSNVTNMNGMFYENQISDLSSLANWKVDNVTDMSLMFYQNQISDLSPLANWKVNNVTDMSVMFSTNKISNLSPLANWKTDNVTDMHVMFSFNQISNLSPLANWKVNNVTDMSGMFLSNQIKDLSSLANWNVDNVGIMNEMFEQNQIKDLSSLANWNVDNVGNMNEMFEQNQISDLSPLANWHVNNVAGMYAMFAQNHISNLSPLTNWKVNNVIYMTMMFSGNHISNLSPLAGWKVDNVTDMSGMFEQNQISDLSPLANWHVNNVTEMSEMFDNNISSIPTKTVQAKRIINFVYPEGYTGKKQDPVTQTIDVPTEEAKVELTTKDSKPSNNILDWVTKTETPISAPIDPVYFQDYTVPEIKGMLEPDKTVVSREQADITKPINVTVTYKLVASNTNDAFALDSKHGLHEHANVNDNGGYDSDFWGKINVDDWNYTVNGDTITINGLKDSASFGANDAVIVPNLDDFKLVGKDGGAKAAYISKDVLRKTARHKYYGLSKTNGNTFTTDSDLNNAFSYASNLTHADLNSLNTGNATDMTSMFYGASSLTNLDVSNWDTSSVTNMFSMFYGASSLTNLDVSNWDTSKVTTMYAMLYNASGLTSLDVSNWNTSNVTDMHSMFYGTSDLTNLDVSNWKTGKVTDMAFMFYGTSDLTSLDLSKWNTSNVTNMHSMFFNATHLTNIGDLSKWDTSHVTDMSYMFVSVKALHRLNISNWNLTKLANKDAMAYMFANDTNYTNLAVIANDLKLPTWYQNEINDADYFWNNHMAVITNVPELIKATGDINNLKIDKQDASRSIFYDSKGSSDAIEVLTDANNQYIADYNKTNPSKLLKLSNTVDQSDPISLANASFVTVPNTVKTIITYHDSTDNMDLPHTQELSGINQITIEPSNLILPENYELDGNLPAMQYGTNYLINVKHKTAVVIQQDPATRTINVHLPNGTTKVYQQVIGYQCDVITDLVTKTVTNGTWTVNDVTSSFTIDGVKQLEHSYVLQNGTYNYANVKLPKIPGYKAKISLIPSGNSVQPAMFLVSFVALPNVNLGTQNAPDDTKQDQDAVINTKQDQDAVINTKQDQNAPDDTKQDQDAVINTKQDQDAVINTKQDQDAVINTKQDQDAVINTKHLNTSNMQIVSNQPALLENADNNLQTLNADTNTSTWQIENNVADELITPYVVFNSSHELHLPRFDNYNLQIIKRTSNKDDLSFVYLDQNKTFKYVFNIKIEDGKYLLSISQIENKRLIPVQEISFNDYHQLIKLIVKLINK